MTYEVWSKLHALGLGESLADEAASILKALAFLELEPAVLARALEPFPHPIRALDAMHLASADFLRRQGQDVEIATYDTRMIATAREMGFELYPLN